MYQPVPKLIPFINFCFPCSLSQPSVRARMARRRRSPARQAKQALARPEESEEADTKVGKAALTRAVQSANAEIERGNLVEADKQLAVAMDRRRALASKRALTETNMLRSKISAQRRQRHSTKISPDNSIPTPPPLLLPPPRCVSIAWALIVGSLAAFAVWYAPTIALQHTRPPTPPATIPQLHNAAPKSPYLISPVSPRPSPHQPEDDDDEILCDCRWTRWPGQSCDETSGNPNFPCWPHCCS